MTDTQDVLREMRETAAEIARVGIAGFGNRCTCWADALEADQNALKTVHTIVGGMGFPDMIQRIRNLITEIEKQDAEIERLKGMKPAPLDTPIPAGALPRYMVRWNGPKTPLAVPSNDGYWTPWHIANAEIEQLRALLSEARDALRYETEANYPDRNQLPSDMHGYEMDMDIVHRIEAALAAKEVTP